VTGKVSHPVPAWRPVPLKGAYGLSTPTAGPLIVPFSEAARETLDFVRIKKTALFWNIFSDSKAVGFHIRVLMILDLKIIIWTPMPHHITGKKGMQL
jgi:hypothetical protein